MYSGLLAIGGGADFSVPMNYPPNLRPENIICMYNNLSVNIDTLYRYSSLDSRKVANSFCQTYATKIKGREKEERTRKRFYFLELHSLAVKSLHYLLRIFINS
jgi:hypothetical protein